MKTEDQIEERISSIQKKKSILKDAYILAVDKEQQDFLAAEIVRYDFMIMELEWVIKK